MSAMTIDRDSLTPDVAPASPGLRRALVAIIAVAVLVVAGATGYLLRGDSSSATSSTPPKVDVGFSQDMTAHHQQAVTMAGYERDNTSDPQLKILAFDIETSQEFQIGEMQGWMDNWNVSRNNADPMAWMGHAQMTMTGNLMPGMATAAQMTKLETLHGKALDIMFLQLMIHHHQGGLPMARYALEHATEQYTRDLAQSMISAQSSELISMEQTLRQLGGTPLQPPAS